VIQGFDQSLQPHGRRNNFVRKVHYLGRVQFGKEFWIMNPEENYFDNKCKPPIRK